MCVCVPYKPWFYFFRLRCILCVAGTSVNNYKSNIINNGEYFYMVKNIKFCSHLDYGCIQVKVHNYFNNYCNYNFIFSELDDVAKLPNKSDSNSS